MAIIFPTNSDTKARYDELGGGFSIQKNEGSIDISDRIEKLFKLLCSSIDNPDYEVDGQTFTAELQFKEYLAFNTSDDFIAVYSHHPMLRDQHHVIKYLEMPQPVQKLVTNIDNSVKKIAWSTLHSRLQTVPNTLPHPSRLRVFISYRSTKKRFAEALANRLGQNNIVPWLDEWEILAGDSIPGKIEEGLRDSDAMVILLSADYQSGRWCIEEYESAIHKRIEESFKIVPVLLEDCEPLELIRHLKYVDCRDHDETRFERQVTAIIDAIFGLELNPYR